MSFQYSDIAGDEKAVLAHTGLSIAEFEELARVFNQEWLDYNENYTLEGKLRVRKSKGRKNNVLATIEDKLLFILFFLKTNPIQEVLASTFDLNQPQTCNWLELLRVRLLATLAKENVLPSRKANRIRGMLTAAGANTVSVDSAEKRVVKKTKQIFQAEVALQ